uniref:Uncharacterized protein n=1 Tax=Oryza brachyantha TaxID=4533 RepID=J3LCU0_ORYBR
MARDEVVPLFLYYYYPQCKPIFLSPHPPFPNRGKSRLRPEAGTCGGGGAGEEKGRRGRAPVGGESGWAREGWMDERKRAREKGDSGRGGGGRESLVAACRYGNNVLFPVKWRGCCLCGSRGKDAGFACRWPAAAAAAASKRAMIVGRPRRTDDPDRGSRCSQ